MELSIPLSKKNESLFRQVYKGLRIRGYIQHWLKSEKEIPNHSAARIFAAATSILKAGTAAPGSQ